MFLKSRVGIINKAPQTNYISHIQELRVLTNLGLKEAKGITDNIVINGPIPFEPETQYQLDAFRNSNYWVLLGVPPKFTSTIYDTLKDVFIDLVHEDELESAKMVLRAIEKLKQREGVY